MSTVMSVIALACFLAAIVIGARTATRTTDRVDLALYVILLVAGGGWVVVMIGDITAPGWLRAAVGLLLAATIATYLVRSLLWLRASQRELDRLAAEQPGWFRAPRDPGTHDDPLR